MNAAFLITPKNEVEFVYEDWTIRQALEKMEHYRYTAIPVLNRSGRYVGTLTEGDMLWNLKNHASLDFKDTEHLPLSHVPRHRDSSAMSINVAIEDMIETSLTQNFVPIVDDSGVFIGIIRRKEIISYLLAQQTKVRC
ncbi:CBS domain-containing protein [Sporolactobacillus terrae]|nr:CBS domain-containing protein [Sporolactobacillus terrae]QAA23382.1 CBS domain-containing protein [Sporolactobacillus terrae]QAA26353.1 CBS domain-containing protein [Sporolactobacillus terrae]UAK15445.1 CBS domain-containing protein [Sporolactobacillus terrae]